MERMIWSSNAFGKSFSRLTSPVVDVFWQRLCQFCSADTPDRRGRLRSPPTRRSADLNLKVECVFPVSAGDPPRSLGIFIASWFPGHSPGRAGVWVDKDVPEGQSSASKDQNGSGDIVVLFPEHVCKGCPPHGHLMLAFQTWYASGEKGHADLKR